MKILFNPCHYIYDSYSSGSEISWAFEIANGISSRHKDSVVVTGFKKIDIKPTYKIIELQSNKDALDISLINALKFNFLYTIETLKQVSKTTTDVIHHVLPFGIDTTYNVYPILFRKKYNVPFVLGPLQSPLDYEDTRINNKNIRSNKSSKFYYYRDKLFKKVFNIPLYFLSNLTLKKSDKVIVINTHTKNILLNRGVSEDNICVIPPGIDTNKFNYVPFKNKTDTELKLITASYLVKRKGIDLLLKSLKEVIQDNKKVHLTIVGTGREEEKLKKLCSDLNLNSHVDFTGFIENSDIHKYYEKSHIFVSMSRSESWGQMYLEAMSCGLPVITSKNLGSLEIIEEGKTGYFIEQEQYKEMADKIKQIANKKMLIQKLSKNSRRVVEDKYDWNKSIIPKYYKIYKELI